MRVDKSEVEARGNGRNFFKKNPCAMGGPKETVEDGAEWMELTSWPPIADGLVMDFAEADRTGLGSTSRCGRLIHVRTSPYIT